MTAASFSAGNGIEEGGSACAHGLCTVPWCVRGTACARHTCGARQGAPFCFARGGLRCQLRFYIGLAPFAFCRYPVTGHRRISRRKGRAELGCTRRQLPIAILELAAFMG